MKAWGEHEGKREFAPSVSPPIRSSSLLLPSLTLYFLFLLFLLFILSLSVFCVFPFVCSFLSVCFHQLLFIFFSPFPLFYPLLFPFSLLPPSPFPFPLPPFPLPLYISLPFPLPLCTPLSLSFSPFCSHLLTFPSPFSCSHFLLPHPLPHCPPFPLLPFSSTTFPFLAPFPYFLFLLSPFPFPFLLLPIYSSTLPPFPSPLSSLFSSCSSSLPPPASSSFIHSYSLLPPLLAPLPSSHKCNLSLYR